MTIYDLEQIVCIADELNISRASKQLFMSQSSLSQTIKRVEKVIGRPLFSRTAAGLSLTPVGERVTALAREILQIKSNLDADLKKMSVCRTGRFAIGIPSFWSFSILPAVLPKLCAGYPNLEISIKEANSDQMDNMLLGGEIDVAINPIETHSDKIASHVLFKEEILVAVSSKNPVSSSGKADGAHHILEPEVLKGQTFILSQKMPEILKAANRFFAAYNFGSQALMFANSIETIKQLTLRDLGISFIPRSYARYDSDIERPLYFHIDSDVLPRWTLSAAYLKKESGNKMLRAFIDLLSEHLESKSDGME